MIYFLAPLGVLIFLLACSAPFFLLKRLSPIPYFPSNARDISLILKQIHLTNDMVLYDLGAGDGVIIFRAATAAYKKRFNTRFIAYEINPYLLLFMHIKRLFHPNRSNIAVRKGDVFSTDYPLSPHTNTIFFTYISPWFMEKTVQNVARQLPKKASVPWVSYFYEAPKSKLYRCRQLSHTRGVHDIYRYTISSS